MSGTPRARSALRVGPRVDDGSETVTLEPPAHGTEPLAHGTEPPAHGIDPTTSRRTPAPLVLPLAPAERGQAAVEVVVDGWRFELVVEDDARATLRERATRGDTTSRADGPVEVRAIIPGRVVGVLVEEGTEVERGQAVLVVEAMKMQNEIRAPRDGRVGRIGVAVGATVELGDRLLVIE